MQIISNIALISINETLIVQLISFLIFLFIINRVMIRPLRGAMRDREALLENIKVDMDDAREQFEKVSLQIKDQESKAVREANAIREQIEQTGKEEADRVLKAAGDDVSRLIVDAKEKIAAGVAEAKKSVMAESETLAVSMIEHILDRRLNQ
jgi:F-type H+-transporting ATPase subunit b